MNTPKNPFLYSPSLQIVTRANALDAIGLSQDGFVAVKDNFRGRPKGHRSPGETRFHWHETYLVPSGADGRVLDSCAELRKVPADAPYFPDAPSLTRFFRERREVYMYSRNTPTHVGNPAIGWPILRTLNFGVPIFLKIQPEYFEGKCHATHDRINPSHHKK